MPLRLCARSSFPQNFTKNFFEALGQDVIFFQCQALSHKTIFSGGVLCVPVRLALNDEPSSATACKPFVSQSSFYFLSLSHQPVSQTITTIATPTTIQPWHAVFPYPNASLQKPGKPSSSPPAWTPYTSAFPSDPLRYPKWNN